MLTVPNLITLLRLPLAFAFLFVESPLARASILLLAMLSDALDGYFARRYMQTSKLGTVLDPLLDRFFVFFIVAILLQEQHLKTWQAVTMLSRDFAIMFFGVYLTYAGTLSKYEFHALMFGKITTALQLCVLSCLVLHIPIPPVMFYCFILLGFLAFGELYIGRNRVHNKT